MVEMTADAMEQAPVTSRFGKLPASDTELNGDYLQTLTRLAVMTGDNARHRRVMNLQQNLVRLNEFPEWFTVDENMLYRIGRAGTSGEVRLGSELIAGSRSTPARGSSKH